MCRPVVRLRRSHRRYLRARRSSWFTAKAKRVNVRSMSSEINLYDRVPYPSLAFLQTHPDRLAVMGTLYGMNPVAVEHCRVLEIACGNGSNLIPMAYGLPGSQFVGIDLAANPVEFAQERIRRLGLKNIRIKQMDLLEIGPEFGEFDYIIAHGVYAWVPQAVQEKSSRFAKRISAPMVWRSSATTHNRQGTSGKPFAR